MFGNTKKTIQELAYSAVSAAEQALASGTGAEKKEMAVEYVVSMLPIASVFKPIVVKLLSKFIDEAIENAVGYMKQVKNAEA